MPRSRRDHGSASEDQANSTRHFMRELNRLGLTSIIDAGGGFQNYPDDYGVVDALHRAGQLTVRIAYNLFTQQPKQELTDFQRWTSTAALYQGDASYRLNGAGEMLAFSAADFEDFLEPRARSRAGDGGGSRVGGSSPGAASMAVPAARHLQRVNHALSRRVRTRAP